MTDRNDSEPTDINRQPTTLYRLFDHQGNLLYVGIAGNPGRRFAQHSGDKHWWGDVAETTLTHFDTRAEALRAEKRAIRDEHPAYNVVHSRPPAVDRRGDILAASADDVAGMVGWKCQRLGLSPSVAFAISLELAVNFAQQLLSHELSDVAVLAEERHASEAQLEDEFGSDEDEDGQEFLAYNATSEGDAWAAGFAGMSV